MWKILAFLGLFIGLCAGHGPNSPDPTSPIPPRSVEPKWKAPLAYLKMRRHDVVYRDHGCTILKTDVEAEFGCVDIWLKNKFSESRPPVSPTSVFTEFEYNNLTYSYKPAVTWVENINPWRIRACVAAPGGRGSVLKGGKMRWFALYNMPQSNFEQSGIINHQAQVTQPVTTASYCFTVTFPQAFLSTPVINLQYKLKYGYHSTQEAMVLWARSVTATSMEICMEEFYSWSSYHHDYEIHWYGISAKHSQDQYSTHNKLIFSAGDTYPADHKELNDFYCKTITVPKLYPCPAILIQPVQQSTGICESPLVAWIAKMDGDKATICYADKRGIMDKRKATVEVHYIMYGHPDPCNAITCPSNQECVHPTWNTAVCGCFKMCPKDGEKVCGTNMKTYENRCHLDKEACESGFKFSYAHHGECEKYTMDHGRVQLEASTTCEGLYCKVIQTGRNVWYKDADISVQISVNWMNDISEKMPSTHDATASWVEDVKPNSFKACIMDAGRKTLIKAPSINWFAYQGKFEHMKSHRIEVGEWKTGTHCAPIHERKVMEKPMESHRPSCPSIDLRDSEDEEKSKKSDGEQWHYNAHVMSQIFGKEQHEWLKRMMTGYGVKRMNLTNGMEMKDSTLMMTVEHSEAKSRSPVQDAVNVWMEYDASLEEAYVCLRELNNWEGLHKGIHVHWTLFKYSMIPDVGFSHKLMFKPYFMAPKYDNYAFCQTKQLLPKNFSLINSATVLASVSHRIPAHSVFESMKKFRMHQQEVNKGVPVGYMEFHKPEVQKSWMMPHMWRANLSGWRPHMRILKNSDYSVWIEGMNGTHIRVCQKSLYTGFHYEGVMVSLFVLPDRCPQGYSHFHGVCGKASSVCTGITSASSECSKDGSFFGAPDTAMENYWYSYLASQRTIALAKSDSAQEGVWKRSFGLFSQSKYARWGEGQPSNSSVLSDCVAQDGVTGDFKERDVLCSSCLDYVCVRPAPQLSCKFSKKGPCMNDGRCTYKTPFNYLCQCKPPFSGTSCEIKN